MCAGRANFNWKYGRDSYLIFACCLRMTYVGAEKIDVGLKEFFVIICEEYESPCETVLC